MPIEFGDQTSVPVPPRHDSTVRNRASDIGDKRGDDGEVRRPPDVGNRGYQDLTALYFARIHYRLGNTYDAFPASSIPTLPGPRLSPRPHCVPS